MRFSIGIWVTAALALCVTPQLAAAADDGALQQMSQRLDELEGELQATHEELEASNELMDAQKELLENAGLDRQAQSGLSAFLSETQFSGYLAVSWNYNFTRPDASTTSGWGENNGSMWLTAPFYGNHNTFQVDQFFVSMIKPATAESRAGWGAELVWGSNVFSGEWPGTDGSFSWLYQGYVEYLAHCDCLAALGDVNFKVGRWETPIGVESFRSDRNWQITRGVLWALQPINHTGLMISGNVGDTGIDYGLGAANSFGPTMADQDNDKTFIGTVGYTAETFSFRVNGLYGGDAWDTWLDTLNVSCCNSFVQGGGTNEDKVGLVDAVFTWDPSESLSTWINFDYWFFHNAQHPPNTRPLSSMTIWGIAAASRLAVTESTGVSLRFEWLEFNDADLDFANIVGNPNILTDSPAVLPALLQSGRDVRLWTLTGTVDHALTDNLTVKAEVRWDNGWAQGTNDRFFVRRTDRMGDVNGNDRLYTKQSQILGLIQMMYRF